MWEENFGTSADAHLREGVRLIWGPHNTGFTVYKYLWYFCFEFRKFSNSRIFREPFSGNFRPITYTFTTVSEVPKFLARHWVNQTVCADWLKSGATIVTIHNRQEPQSMGSARTYDMRQFCYFQNKLRHPDDTYPRGSTHIRWVLAWMLSCCVIKWLELRDSLADFSEQRQGIRTRALICSFILWANRQGEFFRVEKKDFNFSLWLSNICSR